MAKKRKKLKRNTKLFKEALKYLIGGVNSPARSFKATGASPLLIKKGKGAHIWDYDGNAYIDYVQSWGALLLGHAHPGVMDKIRGAIHHGLGFGTTNESEIELAKIICQATGFVERIRFTNSGTEAVMGAVRLARGFTARDKIVKFKRAYHGHADYLLDKSGGIPADFLKQIIIAPSGDAKFLEGIFRKQGDEIAAVLVEPVGGNDGVIEPDRDFLKRARDTTKRYKSLLIFDEVITGFRFHFGSFAQRVGITPDVVCLGKIIGGGLPIGAYGGRRNIMSKVSPMGKVFQAGTFSGNPVVMQAGAATLQTVREQKHNYSRIEGLTGYLAEAMQGEAAKRRICLQVSHYGTMFSIRFAHQEQFKKFYGILLERGIFFAPSQSEANFLSFAHTSAEIKDTIDIVRYALTKL